MFIYINFSHRLWTTDGPHKRKHFRWQDDLSQLVEIWMRRGFHTQWIPWKALPSQRKMEWQHHVLPRWDELLKLRRRKLFCFVVAVAFLMLLITWRTGFITLTFCLSWNLANDCGPLQAPMNGTLSGDRTTYPNKINFNCEDGFILRGSTVRQCQSNKHWSGNDTFCEGTW